MKKYCKKITIVLLVLIVSACGFQLRGKIALPTEMAKVYIQSENLRLAGQLGQALKVSGAKIIKNREQATAILKISNVSNRKKVRSVGGAGRAREFRLIYSVSVEIKDAASKIIMKQQTAKLIRDFSFNESQVVGKSVEESIIRKEMERQMISTLLRRIQLNFKAKKLQDATRTR
ncbi:hypothetical protein MNBD_GAMMA12-2045 [hydrothermal vent metagenome]|uniref:LPS-assembly lipoprotein LptE n=1 Tax=hydrothermal vent metagenome TaxID=652676 RepID=A0A3B0YD92_9ZZZZ